MVPNISRFISFKLYNLVITHHQLDRMLWREIWLSIQHEILAVMVQFQKAYQIYIQLHMYLQYQILWSEALFYFANLEPHVPYSGYCFCKTASDSVPVIL